MSRATALALVTLLDDAPLLTRLDLASWLFSAGDDYLTGLGDCLVRDLTTNKEVN